MAEPKQLHLPAMPEPPAPPAESDSTALMRIIERAAMSPDMDIAKLEKLLEVRERWERLQARKAFDEAMAGARAELPVIIKNREVDFTSTKGRTHYRYEDLAAVAAAINPILARHGLSYRFRTSSPPNEPVTVTCIVSHRLGHSEENTLCAGRDDSGNKNSIQAIGSTITYLQRMTLKAALGLAAAADDDGRNADGNDEPVTDEQRDTILKRLDEAGADIERFCNYIGAPSIGEIKQRDFKRALDAIAAKGRRAAP